MIRFPHARGLGHWGTSCLLALLSAWPAGAAETEHTATQAAHWTPARPRPSQRWSDPADRSRAQRESAGQAVRAQHVSVTQTSSGGRRSAQSGERVASRSVSADIRLAPGETLVSEGESPTPAGQPFAEEVEPGVIENFDGSGFQGGDCEQCGDGCGDCDECGSCGKKVCICWDWCWFEDLGLFAGVHGYKGPADLGRNGNFGFHEGFNFGAPLIDEWGVGLQIGGQFTHSNLSSEESTPGFPAGDDRQQTFLTGGLFHRAVCGLQWGVAADWLHDEYYVDMDLTQIRGEIGYVGPCHNELGFWFASGSEDDTQTLDALNPTLTETWTVTDLYALFYRRHFGPGGEFRAWAGFSGESDVIVGADFHIPLKDQWAVEANFNYLIPEQGSGFEGSAEESWGLAINLVWFPFRDGCCPQNECWGEGRQYRPLLNVADNATFMMDRSGDADQLIP